MILNKIFTYSLLTWPTPINKQVIINNNLHVQHITVYKLLFPFFISFPPNHTFGYSLDQYFWMPAMR